MSGKQTRTSPSTSMRLARGAAEEGLHEEAIAHYQDAIRGFLVRYGEKTLVEVDKSLELHEIAYGLQVVTLEDEMVTIKKRLYELYASRGSRALKSRCLAYADVSVRAELLSA